MRRWGVIGALGLVLAGQCVRGEESGAARKASEKVVAPIRFMPGELDLAPGESYPAELFVPSPTGKAASASLSFKPEKGISVTPDPRWKGRIPPWGVKTYPKLTAAPDAEGDIPVGVALEGGGQTTLVVRVVRPQLELVPGLFKLTVKVTSPFRTRVMTGRIRASNPDRFLEDVTTREFKVAPGKTEEVVFPLPGAAPVADEKYDFTLAVETYRGYKDTKTYPLMFPETTDPDKR